MRHSPQSGGFGGKRFGRYDGGSEFGLFRPTIKTKSADTEDAVKASNILSKRIVFTPGKIFNRMLNEMSVTRSVPVDTDYTDGSSSSGNNGSGGSGNGGEEENPLG